MDPDFLGILGEAYSYSEEEYKSYSNLLKDLLISSVTPSTTEGIDVDVLRKKILKDFIHTPASVKEIEEGRFNDLKLDYTIYLTERGLPNHWLEDVDGLLLKAELI